MGAAEERVRREAWDGLEKARIQAGLDGDITVRLSDEDRELLRHKGRQRPALESTAAPGRRRKECRD